MFFCNFFIHNGRVIDFDFSRLMPKNLKSTKMIDYRPIEIDDQKYKKVQKDTKSSRLMLFVKPNFLS